MKTTINTIAKSAILIFTLFLGFQTHFVMAKSPENSSPAKNAPGLSTLAPVTPKEATFDDLLPEKVPAIVSLAPVMPKEATFDDNEISTEISSEFLKKIAPVTPSEADFNDVSPETDNNINIVKFRVPIEANFSDF